MASPPAQHSSQTIFSSADEFLHYLKRRARGTAVIKLLSTLAILAAICYVFYKTSNLPEFFGGEKEHLIDQFYINIGLLYGILAVYSVFVIWEKFNEIIEVMSEEASSLLDLLFLVRQIRDKPFVDSVTKRVYNYATAVKHALWTGAPVEDSKVESTFEDLFATFQKAEVKGEKDTLFLDHAMDELREVSSARAMRRALLDQKVTPIQWFILIFLPVCLLFIFFITEGDALIRTILAGLMSLAFIVVTIIIADMDSPLGGEWGISPYMYQRVLSNIEAYEKRKR
ncbi:DUF4239 domain-containing protein [Candidatus Woesearchaeota archaeon]|nr:DUF4239 domain-containing protein [Candidatus Woesearchaeota archaeon]